MNRREFIQTTLFGSAAVMFAPGLSWAADGGATLKAIKERGVCASVCSTAQPHTIRKILQPEDGPAFAYPWARTLQNILVCS